MGDRQLTNLQTIDAKVRNRNRMQMDFANGQSSDHKTSYGQRPDGERTHRESAHRQSPKRIGADGGAAYGELSKISGMCHPDALLYHLIPIIFLDFGR
jgi:hypothetical protein